MHHFDVKADPLCGMYQIRSAVTWGECMALK